VYTDGADQTEVGQQRARYASTSLTSSATVHRNAPIRHWCQSRPFALHRRGYIARRARLHRLGYPHTPSVLCIVSGSFYMTVVAGPSPCAAALTLLQAHLRMVHTLVDCFLGSFMAASADRSRPPLAVVSALHRCNTSIVGGAKPFVHRFVTRPGFNNVSMLNETTDTDF
jgi:hypothetical protein